MRKRILFIEDEPFTVRALAKSLGECPGHTVDLINNLKEAVTLLSSQKYDLLILDIMLPHNGIIEQNISPKESGIALVRMLRQGKAGDYDISANADLPIVVLTAVVDPRSIREIKEFKPAALLRKPVAWKEFYDAVQKAIGSEASIQ